MTDPIPHFVELPDGRVQVDLGRTVTLGGKPVDSVTLREPTLADHLAAEKAAKGVELDAVLIANLLEETTPAEVKALPFRVFRRLQEALQHFLD